jgi:nuclear GTP-binding protein
VWQYITLMKRIYLIDCPGVVPPSNGDSEQDILLRGVVRVENVEHPAQYITAVLRRAQTKHIERTYEIKHSDYKDDAIEFLSILARKGGRLLQGGEPDVDGVAKMVLNDFLRGKIPWFSAPPKRDGVSGVDDQKGNVLEGREGRLGEMPGKGQKRKRDDMDIGSVGVDGENDAGSADAGDMDDQDLGDGEDGFQSELAISDDIDVSHGDGAEEGVGLENSDDEVDASEGPFESFESDDEDAGGVSAG